MLARKKKSIFPINLSQRRGDQQSRNIIPVSFQSGLGPQPIPVAHLVHNLKHCHYVLILRLQDELCNDPDIIQWALGVRQTHRAVEHVDRPETAGMVPLILGTRKGMEVEVHVDAILVSPLDRFEEVSSLGGWDRDEKRNKMRCMSRRSSQGRAHFHMSRWPNMWAGYGQSSIQHLQFLQSLSQSAYHQLMIAARQIYGDDLQ